MRSALVTGATGFIGSVLVRRLLAERIKVHCLVRGKPRERSTLDALSGAEVIEAASFQTQDLKRSLAGLSAEVVFNLASYGVHQEDRDPEELLDGNVNLVTRLLLATSDWPLKRFIHTGSCSEYGLSSSAESFFSEEAPLRPVSPYGAAKAASFMYGNALAARLAVPFFTLRLFGVFGVGEGPQRLIPYLIERLQRNEPVDLTPGEQVRDLLYVDDVAEAFLVAGRHAGLTPYEAYNVCLGRPVRVREIGEAVADAMNKPRDLLHWGRRPYRKDEPMRIVGDNRRFTEATAWRPKVSLLEGIHRMIAAAEKVGRKSDAKDAV